MNQEEYDALILQVDLKAIWLMHANVTNHHGPQAPGPTEVHITNRPTWEPWGDGFRVRQQYSVRLVREGTTFLDTVVVFGVDYSSPVPMTNELFAPFAMRNLPLNTWPYLREYLASMMGRMNWGTYTLPTFKLHPSGQPLVGNQPFVASHAPETQVRRSK